nr:reverse transcriptase [Tanacetum cinerariifolium]
MTSFSYRLNPRYTIKECLSCGSLYIGDFCCSKGNVKDKILVPKPPKNYAKYAKCGHPNISESSDDSTNVVNAPREPVVVKKDHGVNPPPIDECCCECGNALDGLYCQQCIFKDHDYPNKVYKVVKAFYGLHQAPRAWYETLANYLFKEWFSKGKD